MRHFRCPDEERAINSILGFDGCPVVSVVFLREFKNSRSVIVDNDRCFFACSVKRYGGLGTAGIKHYPVCVDGTGEFPNIAFESAVRPRYSNTVQTSRRGHRHGAAACNGVMKVAGISGLRGRGRIVGHRNSCFVRICCAVTVGITAEHFPAICCGGDVI